MGEQAVLVATAAALPHASNEDVSRISEMSQKVATGFEEISEDSIFVMKNLVQLMGTMQANMSFFNEKVAALETSNANLASENAKLIESLGGKSDNEAPAKQTPPKPAPLVTPEAIIARRLLEKKNSEPAEQLKRMRKHLLQKKLTFQSFQKVFYKLLTMRRKTILNLALTWGPLQET